MPNRKRRYDPSKKGEHQGRQVAKRKHNKMVKEKSSKFKDCSHLGGGALPRAFLGFFFPISSSSSSSPFSLSSGYTKKP